MIYDGISKNIRRVQIEIEEYNRNRRRVHNREGDME